MDTHHPMSRARFRFRPAVLLSLLLAACLTPTDGSGRFGEARVQPQFSAGNSPTELGVQVDSIRTIIRRDAATTIVNAMMAYEADAAQAWIIELLSEADDVEVTMELLVGSSVAYRGSVGMTVTEGSAGRATVEAVPVAYVASDIAARVEVTPEEIALGAIGATRSLQAVVYDPNDVVIPGKVVTWSSVNDDVASVNENGLVIATGAGITNVMATVDGVSDVAIVFVDTMLARSSAIDADSASMAANGLSRTLISVRILDGNGQPIPASAGPVALTTTLGSVGATTDHGDGTYTATLTSGTTAGTAVVTGTLDGEAMSDRAVVEFRPLTSDPGTTTITADSAAINADGVATTVVTVTVRDANGNPVGSGGGVVLLQSTLGNVGAVTDHADGTYTATLRAGTVAGVAVITGTLNGVAITDNASVTLRPLGANPTTTTITADSAALDADGESTTRVTVRVLDENSNPIGASAGTVLLTTSLGNLTQPVDHQDGTYTATLTAGTSVGTAIVSGTLNGGVIGDSAFVTFRPLPPQATTTTITADSAALDADGQSTSLVTVRVLDEHGNPVGASAGEVTLVTSLGMLTLPVFDHGNGTYSSTLTAGTTTGTARITGTLNGAVIGDTAFVELRPLDPAATTTTITADSAALDADGESTTLVTVRVLDEHGNPIGASAGDVVLATTLGTLTPRADHGDGTYTATLTAGTTAGTAIITGTLNGVAISDNALVTLRPLPPHAQTTTITADSAALDADGESTTLVTVRVLDEHGNPVGASAGVVALTTSLGDLSQPVDHQNGTYTATLTAGTMAGTAIISGTLNGIVIGDSAFVTLRPLAPHAQTTTIVADSAALDADGESSTLVTVRVLDEHGNPVGASAGVVALTTSLGDLSQPVDHQNGTYTATLTAGTTAGTATISGTLNGEVIGDSAFVELRPLDPDPTTTTITADSAAIDANGVSTTLVSVRVLDEHGNPVGVGGGTVVLATTLGALTEPVVDHGNGTYTATLTAGTTAGTAIVSGTLNGGVIEDSAFVELRPLAPDPTTTTISADSAAIDANGVSTTLVTVRVLDEHGNPIGESAGDVVLATTLGSLTLRVDHGDGTYTATLTAGTTAGTAIISGTLNGEVIGDSAFVELRPLAPDPTTTTLTADSTSIVADGESFTTVTVRVLDANGNPVGRSAGIVTLATTHGILSAVIDHHDGTYTATLRANVGTFSGNVQASMLIHPDTAVVTGTLNGEAIADSARVELRPFTPPPKTSLLPPGFNLQLWPENAFASKPWIREKETLSSTG
jgi:adhesin/invasin